MINFLHRRIDWTPPIAVGGEGMYLIDAEGNHPHLGDIRGRGLFQPIEFVQDGSTKEPFDSADRLHARV